MSDFKKVRVVASHPTLGKVDFDLLFSANANTDWINWGMWQATRTKGMDYDNLRFFPDAEHPVRHPNSGQFFDSALPYIGLLPKTQRVHPGRVHDFRPMAFKRFNDRKVDPTKWTLLPAATNDAKAALVPVWAATTDAIVNVAQTAKDIFLLKLDGLMNCGFTELEAIEILGELKKKQGQHK